MLTAETAAAPADVAAEPAAAPLVSIVIPCLNEELVIGEFVDWCHQGLRDAGVTGQILIVDSSTDRSAEIAEAHGAEVLRVPKRGLGRAYIDALPHIRGQYVFMGDCDLTYDFRQLRPFLDRFAEGHEFVMGSRFRGTIEPGAMPPLHRYFGTPVTTFILNFIYGTRFSDIHCGMRALTRDALERLRLTSQGWEYASEMVLKAGRLDLRTSEVPVSFYKDREGRLSHHRRSGWLSPWHAGWINLKVMLLYAADLFLLLPGLVLFCMGLVLVLSLLGGPYHIGGVGVDLHSMLLGVTMTTLGYGAAGLGVLARAWYNFDPAWRSTWARWWSYDRGVLAAAGLTVAGLVIAGVVLWRWIAAGGRLESISYPGVFGLLLLLLGFQTFTFTLMLQMINLGAGRDREPSGTKEVRLGSPDLQGRQAR
jgi:glycosyltransferase involved in cell wall biosynthesis